MMNVASPPLVPGGSSQEVINHTRRRPDAGEQRKAKCRLIKARQIKARLPGGRAPNYTGTHTRTLVLLRVGPILLSHRPQTAALEVEMALTDLKEIWQYSPLVGLCLYRAGVGGGK